MGREIRHRIVAVATAQIVILVNRAVPKNALAALMTSETLRILKWHWRHALVGKADDRREIRWLFDMS